MILEEACSRFLALCAVRNEMELEKEENLAGTVAEEVHKAMQRKSRPLS